MITASLSVAIGVAASPVQASPSLSEQLESTSAEQAEAADELAQMRTELDALDAQIVEYEAIIDENAVPLIDASSAVSPTDSMVSRLADLTDYGFSQSDELNIATQGHAAATVVRADLTKRIDLQEQSVAELADQVSELEDEVAAEEAQAEAEAAEAEAEAADAADQEATDSTGSTDSGSDADTTGNAAVDYAYAQLGKPYVFGAAGPDGFDCSGLTQQAWAAAGVSLTHFTNAQWSETQQIGRDELRPGDLVFYNGLGHVAIYVGDGQVIHAPQPGDVVKLSDIDMMSIDGYTRP